MMKLLFVILFSTSLLNAQNDLFSVKSKLFEETQNKLLQMANDTSSYSFQEAVLLVENAFYNDTLTIDYYNNQIDSLASYLNSILELRGIEAYKTSSNFIVWDWMSFKSNMNNNQNCIYDIHNLFGEKDPSIYLITSVIDKKKGNCVSLPFFYKVLVEKMGGEAFIAKGVQHFYIKHLDEFGEWVNVELTNGGDFPRDIWIKENQKISDNSIENGIYMKPLSKVEEISILLSRLGSIYIDKYGYDFFLLDMVDKARELDSMNMHAMSLRQNCVYTFSKIPLYYSNKKYFNNLKDIWEEGDNYMKELGYIELSKEEYFESIKLDLKEYEENYVK